MALTPKQRELKQKRKQAKRPKGSGPNVQPFLPEMDGRSLANHFAHFPIHEAIAPSALFETGIGTLFLSRLAPDGTLGVAGVLLDVFCLGVKNAFFRVMSTGQYEEMMERMAANSGAGIPEAIPPACWRKLVEGGISYAGELGFEPHPDYRVVAPLLGEIDPTACPQRFEYGKEGKPFYMSGPNDSPSLIRHILKQLEQRRGEGNYNVMIGMDGRFLGTPGD